MGEELDVAVRTAQGGRDQPRGRQAVRAGEAEHVAQDTLVDRRIAHNPALADVLLAGLELRLDEGNADAAWLENALHHGEHEGQRDERDVDHDDVHRLRK